MKFLLLILALSFGCESIYVGEYIPGPQGESGDAGDNGLNGEDGLNGISGENGSDGDDGEKGDRGQTGWSGSTGKDGEAGSQGPQGEPGPGTRVTFSGTLDSNGKAIVDLDLDLDDLPMIGLWIWLEDGLSYHGEGWHESGSRFAIKNDSLMYINHPNGQDSLYKIILIR